MFVILPTRNSKGGCLPLHTTLGYLVVLQGKAFAEINQMRERGCALWNRLETDHCNSLMQHIQNSCNVCSFANSGIPGAARICAVSCVFLFPRVAHGQKIIHLVAHGQKKVFVCCTRPKKVSTCCTQPKNGRKENFLMWQPEKLCNDDWWGVHLQTESHSDKF